MSNSLNRTAQAASDIALIADELRSAASALRTADYRAAIVALDGVDELQREALHATVLAWRMTGATWQEIGDSLGVTRQAAWLRFGEHPTS